MYPDDYVSTRKRVVLKKTTKPPLSSVESDSYTPEFTDDEINYLNRYIDLYFDKPFTLRKSDFEEIDSISLEDLVLHIIRECPPSFHIDEFSGQPKELHFHRAARRSLRDIYIIIRCGLKKHKNLEPQDVIMVLVELLFKKQINTSFCPDIRHQVFYGKGGIIYNSDDKTEKVGDIVKRQIEAMREWHNARKK